MVFFRLRRWVVVLVFRWHPRCGVCCVCRLVFFLFAGIRALPSCFKRCPCAGRHLLFFAAAKKSRQKKAANTANIFFLPEGPQPVPRFTRQHFCSRSLPTLRMSASPTSNTRTRASGSEWFLQPRWQTVCRLSRRISWRSYRVGRVYYRSEVRRVRCYGLHTVCHLGGGGISGAARCDAGARSG